MATRWVLKVTVCSVFGLSLMACNDSSSRRDLEENPRAFVQQKTSDLPSLANPARTPGSPGASVPTSVEKQFGGSDVNLNNARYTRYALSTKWNSQPDAVFVAIPGFEGGAANYLPLAENFINLAAKSDLVLELWAVDRRSNQLEDTQGLDVAEEEADALIALDYLFGDDLGLNLSSKLERRIFLHNATSDTAFMANWTSLVHSQDIDAIVEHARSKARNENVFLGGHSAGTGYTARYAATNFNLSGSGVAQPGYAKLKGLILLEGGGSRLNSSSASEETLDLIEAEFDGGMYGAIKDQAARCIDGVTACTVATEQTDCAAQRITKCVEPRFAYAIQPGLLGPEIFAAGEVMALQADTDPDSTSLLQQSFGGDPNNTAIQKVPGLSALQLLLGSEPQTPLASLGSFLDDDGVAVAIATFLATSVGSPGPVVDGLKTWLNNDEEQPAEAFTNNGPAPTKAGSRSPWGVEVESTNLKNLLPAFYRGGTNYPDWYYPSSGLTIGSELGLDTTELSAPPPLGRGRSDIANRTEAGNIDIPVIAFGGSNGLTPYGASFVSFAQSIGVCTAPSCNQSTPRVVNLSSPSEAFPTFGDVSGGFEVYISEGYAHVDIVTGDIDVNNKVVPELVSFVQRNID